MINVEFCRTERRLRIRGHAGSAEKGRDLVCAAASILAYTLADNLSRLAREEKARDVSISLEDGQALIACRPEKGFEREAELVFESLCAGFGLLARDYPNNIRYISFDDIEGPAAPKAAENIGGLSHGRK